MWESINKQIAQQIKPVIHSNEPAEVMMRWFWCAASPRQQAGILKDASDQDRESLLAAMTPERRALVMPLLRKSRK